MITISMSYSPNGMCKDFTNAFLEGTPLQISGELFWVVDLEIDGGPNGDATAIFRMSKLG